MDIRNKRYFRLEMTTARTVEQNLEAQLKEGVLWVKVWDGDKSFYVPADRLMDEKKAYEDLIQHLVWKLSWAMVNAGMTKAEMKRQLIRAGVISK
jgi:hypothetical protein